AGPGTDVRFPTATKDLRPGARKTAYLRPPCAGTPVAMRAGMATTIRFALPVALLLAAATTARAESNPAADNYAWQVAATDATLIGAAVAGFSLEGKDG